MPGPRQGSAETPVLIIGAGPVGMTIALDLDRRGISTIVVEKRREGEPPSVKCNHVASRTMEAFRRLGIAESVRAGGLPADYPNDCVYSTTVTGGEEITRIPIPSRAERKTAFDGPDTWWPTPEPPHRINQIYLEPIMFKHMLARPHIRVLSYHECIAVDQDETGARATIKDLASGAEREIRAQYIIGCEGGRSLVRRHIGATLQGDPVVQRVQSTFIRAPKLLSMIKGRPGWMNLSLNPRRGGNTVAIDGKEKWLIHCYLYEHEEDMTALDRDKQIRTILGVDESFEYHILSQEDWIGRRLVADKFRDRRLFICGDSAHLWVPYAGYGMNAGIGDAMDLTWLLAGVLLGWGGPKLLDAYEAERLPITDQVSHFAMNHALAAIRHRREVPPDIEAPGEKGAQVRAEMGKAVYALNVQQYCCGGLNYGYFYDKSPIIAYDAGKAPSFTMDQFTPSTVPGCRTPHFWMANGRSAYDAFGPWYCLLRFDPTIDVEPLMRAAKAKTVPLKLLDLRSDERTSVYAEPLLISRPDLHVGWRGHSLPSDPAALIEQLSGWAA